MARRPRGSAIIIIASALAEAFPQPSSLDEMPLMAQRMLAAQTRAGCVVY